MPDSPEQVRADPARAAERALLRFVSALIVALLGAGVLVAADRRDDRDGSRSRPALASGPGAGDEVEVYARRRRSSLVDLKGRTWAVVSFSAYVSEPVARGLVGPVAVHALLAAAPGGEPSVVTGPLEVWAARARAAAAAERRELEAVLASGTVADPDFVGTYRDDVARLARVEAGSDPRGEVVFAVVVEAPAAGLRRLAGAPGIRLVDPVAPGRRWSGLRPEETVVAGRPPTRP